MTDPTNLRARAEDERPCDLMARVSRLARIGVIVEAWRADDDADGVDAMVAITAILRESAPPPEAPGERRPVAGWRACASRGEKIVAWELRIAPRAKVQEWHAMTLEVSMLHGGRFTFQITDLDGDSLVKAYPDGGAPFDTLAAAQLAAEDAADALLLAGLAVLGRGA